MCDVFLCFVTFSCGVLGQVWYLVVSIPDICLLTYFGVLQVELGVSESLNKFDFFMFLVLRTSQFFVGVLCLVFVL